MSTYLLFFGVGPFEIYPDETDPRVRAVCLPGMGDQTLFGREFGRKALSYGESYYAIDYPLDKMDLIAVPDFAFGAMENWGAITFRENLLLHVPGVTSREAETRICEVIAHEIAHQWFGNLVTPEEWKYLWLNESFATYFGFGMVDHHHRDWEVWHPFVRTQTETAMVRDAFHETFAIEMPGGADVAINSSTAPIIYSKGGSILRQLEAWIGPDYFNKGLRHYLKDFSYGCAASQHLWESLSAASQMPVSKLMRNWVTQPGFPLITVERENDTLQFRQQRFTFLPNEKNQLWMMPISITAYDGNGNASEHTFLMEEERAELTLLPGSTVYKINPDQTGFHHVQYVDTANLDRLMTLVKNGTLSPLDRWGLQNDLFALVKAGQCSMDRFLGMAGQYIGETGYLPLSSLDSHLFEAALVLGGKWRKRSVQMAETLATTALDIIGWEPRSAEPQNTAMLRDQLLTHGVLAEHRRVLTFLTELFEKFMNGSEIPPDIFKSAMTAGAITGDRATLAAMLHRVEESTVEQERMTLVTALGAFKKWELLEEALDYALKEVPDRIRYMPLVAAAGNPAASDALWSWFEDQLPGMQNMHPLLFERIVAAFVPVPGLLDPERTQSFCRSLTVSHPRLKDIIALSLERLEVNMRWREREK
jgi:tricorn protease interacting factor F2/3